MKKYTLVKKENRKAKDILIVSNYKDARSVLNKTSMKILEKLWDNEMYPMEIAKELNFHEQKVYYYIRNLIKAGLIKETRTEEKRGGLARYYRSVAPALGVELSVGDTEFKKISAEKNFTRFFNSMSKEGVLDSWIVVGSPDPHGPFKQRARDGHYACQLSMALGTAFMLPESFLVKLDVDIMSEGKSGDNMILIGGPISNIVTNNIKENLPVKFGKDGVKQITGNAGSYTDDSIGMICKIKNPNDKDKEIILMAGNSSLGTKSAVLAATKYSSKIFADYESGKEFYRIIQGFDLDGDGKIDSVEVLE